MSEEFLLTITRDVHHIRQEQEEMRAMIASITEAINKLAVIEERQANFSRAVDRVMTVVEKLDERIRVIEIANTLNSKATMWVDRLLWAVISGVLVYIGSKLALF